jgi:transposase InsO family protein
VSEKYAFIVAESATSDDAPTITAMCAWLAVSKSGFYEWLGRPASATAQRREEIKIKIKTLFDSFDGTYGYRRIHAELVRAGERVGDELVRKLMRELNLVPVQPKPYKRTTIPGEADPAVADLVARDFTAQQPRAKLVGDITFIPTWEGWLNRDGDRLLQQGGDRLVDGRAHAYRAGHRRTRYGRAQSRAASCIPIAAPSTRPPNMSPSSTS